MEKGIVVAKLVMTTFHNRRQQAPSLRLTGLAPALP
jgi:hypothetical protein